MQHTSEYDFSIAERFKVKFLKTQAQSVWDLISVTFTYYTLFEIVKSPAKYSGYLHTEYNRNSGVLAHNF
jgi:hypothetical protein